MRRLDIFPVNTSRAVDVGLVLTHGVILQSQFGIKFVVTVHLLPETNIRQNNINEIFVKKNILKYSVEILRNIQFKCFEILSRYSVEIF